MYLGLDVGGTASRWVLVDAGGAEAARGTAPGASAHLFNADARARLEAVLAEVAGALPGRPRAVHAGITGCGPDEAAAFRALAAPVLRVPEGAITATDDVELAFRAVLAPGAGHLVSAGSGAIGMSLAADGTVTRVGGRGMLIDDAGSGVWIALRALDRLYRAIDMDGDARAAAALAAEIAAAVGGPGWDAVRAHVYAGDRGRIAALAPAVARAADAGCALAQAVLRDAGTELARLAAALLARCGPAPVAVVGGVPRLHPAIAAALRAALPGVTLRFAQVDAALAAARIAHGKATA